MMAANTNRTGAALKILYLNASHCYAATQNALAVAAKDNYDILMLIEPYYPARASTIKAPGWEAICGARSALLIRGDIRHTPHLTGHPDIVATLTNNTVLTCIYTSPNEPMEPPLHTLLTFLQTTNTTKTILGGDLTAELPSSQDASQIKEEHSLRTSSKAQL